MLQNFKVKNRVISASAGSGKTFQLALRYIGLIVNGAPPEKIICLTFSKKAAGEIFDKIIQRLLEWYDDKDCMLREVKIANIKSLSKDEIISIISSLLLKINKLNISTLDSFFVNILASFPFEFGLNSNFQIIDEYEQNLTKQKILKDLLSSKSSNEEKQIIFEAFKQATFGSEEKKPFDKLNEFIDKYHTYFINDPNQNHWGNKDIIWNNKSVINTPSQSYLDKNIIELKESLEIRDDIKTAQFDKFNEFLEEVSEFSHKYKFTDKTNRFFESNIISKLEEISSDLAVITVNRAKIKLNSKECKPLLNIIKSIFTITFHQLLEQTKGIYKTLKLYENRYENIIRKNGKLTFNDITYLLSSNSDGSQISAQQNADNKLYIEYRLDSSYDHWMIDEFQDTNVSQWNIISNLVDEILMDDTFSRSFFYVGDVKQAIYAWRGGDYHLFDYVHQLYRDRFSTEELSICYRSNAEVIGTVNAVFNNLSSISRLSHQTLDIWKKGWQTHKPSPKEKKIGYSCLIKLKSKKISDQVDEKNQYILDILEQIDPVKRNLTVGILTYRNETAKNISEFLQVNDIQVSYDGASSLTDNPTVALILSLIKSITHPGDLFAWEHVNMSPLSSYIESKYKTQSIFITSELNYIYDHSYSKFIEKWVEIISNEIELKEFALIRSSQLKNAAEQFDKTGNKDAIDFINFINKYKISSSAAKRNIQLLTVYKSKGLEYDIIILPELKNKSVNRISNISGLHQKTDQNNLSEWTNYLPKRKIGEIDETINDFVNELDSEHSYESLCCLYVAMTRAKKALYMIAESGSKTGDSLYQSDILLNTLGCSPVINNNKLAPVYEYGDYQWFRSYLQNSEIAQPVKSDTGLNFTPIDFSKTVSPSKTSKQDTNISEILNIDSSSFIQSGNCIHFLFEQITWLDEYKFDEKKLFDLLKCKYSDFIIKESIKLFRNIISDKNLSELFIKPTPQSELWIEKEFSVIADNRWLSGRFDRVTIIKNSSNVIEKVNILDYKLGASNDINKYKTTYSEQLNLYETAISKILKIPSSNIEKSILLVKSCNILYF
ncbi:MAG: UvrD-helicase domain-containing protein [bacterium]|nr:UvrD-helicase domain-containing protein [bacterium]